MSTTPTEDTRSKKEIRVSMLPADLRGPVKEMKLDLDGDGAISIKELEVIIERLIATKGDNKSLRKWLIYMGIFSILLTCIIFGVSIAAARLSKETTVDPVTGIMSTKGTDQAIHTSPVSYYLETLDVVGMENDELSALTDIILSEGAVELSVKGYSRSLVKNQVTFLVEGGTVLYGADGYVSATGTADTLLAFAAYSEDDINATSSEEGVRRLQDKGVAARSQSQSNQAAALAAMKVVAGADSANDNAAATVNTANAAVANAAAANAAAASAAAGGGATPCKQSTDCEGSTPTCWVKDKDHVLSDNEACNEGGAGCFCIP